MTSDIILTDTQRSVLLETLSAYSPPIDRVDVYGSRVDGTARPGSDVDLVLAGLIDWRILSQIHGAVAESYLSIFADVAAYELLSDGEFRDQVLKTAKPLFNRDELLAARDATSRAA